LTIRARLTNQCLAHLQNHALSLLRDGLRGYGMHARPPRGFTDRRGVVAVILAGFDIRLDVLRWDQTHRMAERDQFASPIMRAATRFQGDFGRWASLEERNHLRAAEIGWQNWPVLPIDAV
jgi:hypothetical protein